MSMHKPINRRIGYRLKVAQHALHRRMEEALRPLGMTPAQYAVLSALEEKPDQTNADLAEAAFITAQSMQGVLSKLEKADLVRREPDRHHGRRQLARITQSGRALVERGHRAVEPVERSLEQALAPLDLETALNLMARLKDAMTDYKPAIGDHAR